MGRSRRSLAIFLLASLAISGVALFSRSYQAHGVDLSSAPLMGGWGGVRLKDVTQNFTGPSSIVFRGERASNFEQIAIRESQLGFNAIRASFAPYCSVQNGLSNSSPPDFMGNYTQGELARALSIVEYFNMWIIVDYHGYAEFTNSTMTNCWLSFWFGPNRASGPTGVVGAFKDEYSRIVWEPLNEPDSGSFPVSTTPWCIQNPVQCETNMTTYASEQYQSWLNKDRRMGDTHWVVAQNLCSYACDLDRTQAYLDYPKLNDTVQRVYESLHTYVYYPKMVEHVAYDANNNTKFDFGDTAIVGFIDDNTPLSSDSKLKFVNATTKVGETWSRGKAVIYDVNNDNIFDTGDIPVTGIVPPLGTLLKSDPLIRFVESDANGVWDGWNNSTGDTAARQDYLNMLNETSRLGWPVLNTEGGAFCGSMCPYVVPGAAGYSSVSLRYIQDILLYEDSNVPRIGQMLWAAASWTSTPNGGVYGALNPGQWGTIITSGTFTTIPIAHNVAVTGFDVGDTTIRAGAKALVGVGVRNAGEIGEKDFNVTLSSNNTIIGQQTVPSLPIEAVLSLSFTWNTSQVRPGNYVLTVVAGPVKGQAISDNTRAIGVSVIDGRESLPSNGFAGLFLPSVSAAIIIAALVGGLTMVLRRKAA